MKVLLLTVLLLCVGKNWSHVLKFQSESLDEQEIFGKDVSSNSNAVLQFQQIREEDSVADELKRNDELLRFVSNPITRFLLGKVGCISCKVVVGVIQDLVKQRQSEEEIRVQIEKLCINLGVEDTRVCEGLSHEFMIEVLTVFDQLVLKPSEVCALLVNDCGIPYNPLNHWNVTLPSIPKPPVKPIVPPKPGSPILRILQLSDIHLDVFYKAGTNALCDEPMCCRANDGPSGKNVPKAGKWGDYRNCDTPLWTLENLFQHLVNKSDQFDYILWTGDLPAHDIWNQSRTDQIEALHNLHNLFKKYFPKKPIFSAIGNHESSPVNSFPPPFITGNQSASWLYDVLAEDWSSWLPNSTLKTIKYGAFYEFSPFPGFRIVSINTNFCNNMNWWLLLNSTDPAGQLQWLIKILQSAETNKEKVHIIGHIPPGSNDCMQAWSANYYRIVNRYESTIVAQFFGHTHKDHFEVFYDENGLKRPLGVAYICPSVTPYSYLNPGYRIYTIDGNYSNSSWAVLDHETYLLNLTAANLYNTPKWQLEYTATKAYSMPSLNPVDWDNLITRMSTNNTLLQQFNRYYYKSRTDGSCDEKCRKKVLCELRTGRSHDPSFCIY